MNSSPTISVVILTCDRPELLWKALASLVKQTAKPYEVIIVDDSRKIQTDITRIIARFHSLHIFLVRNTEHSIAYGRSAGANVAHGDYVIYLDDDCQADREYIARFLTHFRKKTAPDAVFGHIRNAIPDNPFAAAQYAYYDRGMRQHFSDFSRPSVLCCGRMLDSEVLGIRRSILLRLGFVARHRRYRNDDVDLGLRMLAQRNTILFDPSIIAWSTPRVSLEALWSAAFWNGFSDAETVHEYRIDLGVSHYPLPFLSWWKDEIQRAGFHGLNRLTFSILLLSFPFVSRIGMAWFTISHL